MERPVVCRVQENRHFLAKSTGKWSPVPMAAAQEARRRPKKRREREFSAWRRYNSLKSLTSRKKTDLDFLQKDLDFLQFGFDFLQYRLGFSSVWAWNSFSAARMAGPAPALPSPLEGVAAKGTDFGAQAFEIARARTELRGPPPAQPDARQPDASQPQNSRIVSGEGGGDSQRGAVGSTAA
jgi:hypothetical protein